MTKIAINGFGRIGRAVYKIITEKYSDLEIVAINDLTDNETLAHLLKYDSIYGKYEKEITCEMLAERDPEKLPWKKLEVDIVLECTGVFSKIEDAQKHIQAGAKKVILSAPGKSEEIPSYLLGINAESFDVEKDNVIDMGSCTTNCLAPIAKILNDNFGIKTGFMTTIHSYTNDQKILDLPHSDLRRARAAAINLIPTSTGATKAIGKVIPQLKGKLDGIAIRVPTPTVSIVDLVVEVEKSTTIEEVNNVFKEAEKTKNFKGIFKTESQLLVSTDYIGESHSSVVDLALTDVHDNLVKVISWYDNEYGYSCRLAQFTNFVASKL
ncbi:type I glyceraldehyde-3-phosphate dehydrogenase [Patescibacteria group bacterium]|nr:type I glyceraldehyde-3-phosphate dehydrogenase [Patescibacteria group bacterium]